MYLRSKITLGLVLVSFFVAIPLTAANAKIDLISPAIWKTNLMAFSFKIYDIFRWVKKKTYVPETKTSMTPMPSLTLTPYPTSFPAQPSHMFFPTPSPAPNSDLYKSSKTEQNKKIEQDKTKMSPNISPISSPRAQDDTNDLANKFSSVERETSILYGNKNTIGPDHYKRLTESLNYLEAKNYRISEISKLREMLASLNPDEKTNPQPIPTASGQPSKVCLDVRPTLVSDFTDFSKIQKITAPGSSSSEGPKGHSFIWTNGQRVPIYAPVDAILESGAYSRDTEDSPNQYNLTFDVKGSCFKFRLDHIDEPIDTIRSALPSTPKIADSRGTSPTKVIEFKAGDLIGYTKGNVFSGNWDFGLYDMSKEGALAQYGSYGLHRYSVCWPDYYSTDKYKKLLEGPKLVCSQSSFTPLPSSPTSTSVNKNPVLKNLGVSFESWDRGTNRAGAFIFSSSENKIFLEYGVEVASSEGGTKILPTFEYRTAPDADVFAAMDGIVTNVSYQSNTQDYEIHIQPEQNSQWTLGHDHVVNLRVSKGDNVKAGDILGGVGSFNGGLGRTEIMLWTSSPSGPLSYCPFKYFDLQFLSQYQQKVQQHMKDWEDFKGNTSLYNEEKHFMPGCVFESRLDN